MHLLCRHEIRELHDCLENQRQYTSKIEQGDISVQAQSFGTSGWTIWQSKEKIKLSQLRKTDSVMIPPHNADENNIEYTFKI